MNQQHSEELSRKCPICFNSKGEILYHQEFVLSDVESLGKFDKYNVVCCTQCGFVFADVSADALFEEAYTDYYKKINKYTSWESGGGGVTKWDAARMEAMAYDIDAMLDGNTDASVLDIGCGSGGLLLALKNAGYLNLSGIDISDNCIENVKNKGIYAFTADFAIEDFTRNTQLHGKFDCVVLSHVMEHVYDLPKAVSNAVSCLKEGGLLYVEVPDAIRYPEYFSIPFHYFDLEHINHFDRMSMNNLLLKQNLECLLHKQKEVFLTNKFCIPSFFSAYRKAGQQKQAYFEQCIELPEKIKEYISKSHQSNHWPQIEILKNSCEAVAVWGADWFAAWLLAKTELRKCNIQFFVDNDIKKQGASLDGIKIFSPGELNTFDGSIIICSAFHSEAILNEIHSRNLENNIVNLMPYPGGG